MHEATKKQLSILLQKIEGFKNNSKNIFICATNLRNDIDKALLSRFNIIITFDLPDESTRKLIFSKYAKHLNMRDLSNLAEMSNEMSGRDIKEICEQTEREFASELIRKNANNYSSNNKVYDNKLPNTQNYTDVLKKKKKMLQHLT